MNFYPLHCYIITYETKISRQESNYLMPQEYDDISVRPATRCKYRYSTGAKIFLILLTVFTVAALFGLYQV
ncbi:hypothetical protein D7N80_27800, partial [Salmonella enterica subsp. enterica]|nr:hypothetical protein [Salmonella enterica subsp. enterica serovar Kidderminster]